MIEFTAAYRVAGDPDDAARLLAAPEGHTENGLGCAMPATRRMKEAYRFDPEAELVLADLLQIQQVLLDLMRNAVAPSRRAARDERGERHRRGLARERSLLESHGSRITVETQPGNGTTIRFTSRSVEEEELSHAR